MTPLFGKRSPRPAVLALRVSTPFLFARLRGGNCPLFALIADRHAGLPPGRPPRIQFTEGTVRPTRLIVVQPRDQRTGGRSGLAARVPNLNLRMLIETRDHEQSLDVVGWV